MRPLSNSCHSTESSRVELRSNPEPISLFLSELANHHPKVLKPIAIIISNVHPIQYHHNLFISFIISQQY
ncbi:hypothetical protein BLOT_004180 [Blomia tropicalis]|nr:hypothetical protein BLOT_004180 [Blomia tropicalis]